MLSLRTELDFKSKPLHKGQNSNWIQLFIMEQQWTSKLLSSATYHAKIFSSQLFLKITLKTPLLLCATDFLNFSCFPPQILWCFSKNSSCVSLQCLIRWRIFHCQIRIKLLPNFLAIFLTLSQSRSEQHAKYNAKWCQGKGQVLWGQFF